MKILYVEDEIAHFMLTERTLEENLHQEFCLIHTEKVEDALKLLDSEPDIDPPDLCLVHPSMLDAEGRNQRQLEVNKLTVRPYRPVLPGHIWIGIEDKN